jgi:hypothetical protein
MKDIQIEWMSDEQKPVAVIYSVRVGGGIEGSLRKGANAAEVIGKPLYTHPVRPLTDDEIALIIGECAARHEHTDYGFARAIEAAHGIGGEK